VKLPHEDLFFYPELRSQYSFCVDYVMIINKEVGYVVDSTDAFALKFEFWLQFKSWLKYDSVQADRVTE